MKPPALSNDVRMAHLAKANMIRSYRAVLKRNIEAGTGSVILTLNRPPEEVMTMRVRDLLVAIPKLGKVKVRALMNTCQIADVKTVGGLSLRQRAALIVALNERGIR